MGDTVFSSISLEGTGQLSIRTIAATSELVSGQIGLLQQASGISLVYRSDATAYIISGVTIADKSLMSESV